MSIASTMINTVGFVLVFSLAVWIFLKIKNKKTKANDPKPQETKGIDDKVDNKTAQANTSLIKVTIFRPLSTGLVAQVGDPIMCAEKNDVHNNLMVVNEEKNFKEDFNFNKDRIFEMLDFSLKTQNKSNKLKEILILESIEKQETLVNRLDTEVELNAEFNAMDENLKLRQLKVLNESLQMETVGNYMRLGKGGIRQYELVAVDGILYPYFFGSKWYRVYPDLTIKKKIFNQENTIFRNEVGNLQKGILNWMVIATLIIGLLMMAGAYSKNTEVTMTANQGALSCANTLAEINENYGDIIIDYQKLKTRQTTSIKKTEIPNSNIGGILIDPGKIGN